MWHLTRERIRQQIEECQALFGRESASAQYARDVLAEYDMEHHDCVVCRLQVTDIQR